MAKDPKASAGKSKDKAAKKAARAAKKAQRRETWRNVRAAFTMTRKADPLLIPWMVLAFVVPFVLLLALGLLIGGSFVYSIGFLGLVAGVVGMMVIFGRRVQSAQYTQVEGQIGAGAAVLQAMRGQWHVTPAVGFTREQDLVHRVLGRPGIILVAEGARQRTGSLIGNEKKRVSRALGDTPVYEVFIGDGEGQVPLRGLERHLKKLPRNLKPREVNILDRKLKAMAPPMPIPKGPVPGVNSRMQRPRQR
jgi:hypothetical protein